MSFKKGDSVAVIVVSYNSMETIIDTLESVYRQTYSNIELIVADDGSTDDTCIITGEWIKEKGDRFTRVVFIKDHSNYGIAANLNLAVKECRSEWLKDIAADDILMDCCIELCVEACCKFEDCAVFQSNELYIDDKNDLIGSSYAESYRMMKTAEMKSVKDQYRAFLFYDIKLSPTLFYRKNAYDKIGGCDESIRNIEDYPLKLRFLRNGYRMGYINRVTVKYRIHQSVSHDSTKCFKPDHWRLRKQLIRSYCYPYVPFWRLNFWISEANETITYYIVTRLFSNRITIGSQFFIRIMLMIDPRFLHNRIISILAHRNKQIQMN